MFKALDHRPDCKTSIYVCQDETTIAALQIVLILDILIGREQHSNPSASAFVSKSPFEILIPTSLYRLRDVMTHKETAYPARGAVVKENAHQR